MMLQLICTCSNEYSTGQQRHSMDGTAMDSGQVREGIQSCWSYLASQNGHQTIDNPSKV